MAIDLNDKSANSNTLTNSGVAEHTADTPFPASTIAGDFELSDGDYFSAADSASLSFTGDFALECWGKLEQLPSTAGANMALILKDALGVQRSYKMLLRTDDKMRAFFLDSSQNLTGFETDAAIVVGGGCW